MNQPLKRLPITTSKFDLQQQVQNVFYATIDDNYSREDLLQPELWANVSQQMKPFDEIRVLCRGSDKTWIVDLIILDCGKNYAKCIEKNGTYQEFDDKNTSQGISLEGFKVRWVNMHTGFQIIRESDKQVIKEGLKNRDQAIKWLTDNINSLRAKEPKGNKAA